MSEEFDPADYSFVVKTYREHSFDNMKVFAAKHGFTFPYVIDETQVVARTYGAQCTPDFFGFNAQDELQYRADGSMRRARRWCPMLAATFCPSRLRWLHHSQLRHSRPVT